MTYSCNSQKEVYDKYPELIKYKATSKVTEFSYKFSEGDTAQIGLARDKIYISFKNLGNQSIINVRVEHGK